MDKLVHVLFGPRVLCLCCLWNAFKQIGRSDVQRLMHADLLFYLFSFFFIHQIHRLLKDQFLHGINFIMLLNCCLTTSFQQRLWILGIKVDQTLVLILGSISLRQHSRIDRTYDGVELVWALDVAIVLLMLGLDDWKHKLYFLRLLIFVFQNDGLCRRFHFFLFFFLILLLDRRFQIQKRVRRLILELVLQFPMKEHVEVIEVDVLLRIQFILRTTSAFAL